jgi:hypothetical protein
VTFARSTSLRNSATFRPVTASNSVSVSTRPPGFQLAPHRGATQLTPTKEFGSAPTLWLVSDFLANPSPGYLAPDRPTHTHPHQNESLAFHSRYRDLDPRSGPETFSSTHTSFFLQPTPKHSSPSPTQDLTSQLLHLSPYVPSNYLLGPSSVVLPGRAHNSPRDRIPATSQVLKP